MTFNYVECPLNPEDLNFFRASHMNKLKEALEELDFQYLILDVYTINEGRGFLNLLKKIYYISMHNVEEGENGFAYLKKDIVAEKLEVISSLKEDFIIEGMDQLLIQERSKTYHLWKKKLSKIF